MAANNILEYPPDRDNELLIIANIMRSEENRNHFARQGKYRHFRFKEFQTIAWAVTEIVNEGLDTNIDMILLKSKECPIKFTVEFGFLKTIFDNVEIPTDTLENFKLHLSKLSKDFVQSQLVDKIFNVLHPIASNPTSTISDIEQRLDYMKGILKEGYYESNLDFKGMDVLIPEYIRDRDNRKDKYSTGFYELDKHLTEGFAPKQITTVAALASMGKSSFVLSCMKNLANMGTYTAQFALEMNNTSLIHKLLAYNTRLPLNKIIGPFGNLDEKEQKLYVYELNRLQQNRYLKLNEKPQNLPSIREQIMLLQDNIGQVDKSFNGYIVVVLDLFGKLKELQGSDNFARDYEIHANTVQQMTKELGIHTILVAQIRKDVAQRRFSRPTMNDLKNAGALTEVSDTMLGVHRPYYNPEMALRSKIAASLMGYDPNPSSAVLSSGQSTMMFDDDVPSNSNSNAIMDDMDKNVAEVIIMKQRMGENNLLINFFFDPNTTGFYECTSADQQKLNSNKSDLLGE